jgi:hypothetical protein
VVRGELLLRGISDGNGSTPPRYARSTREAINRALDFGALPPALVHTAVSLLARDPKRLWNDSRSFCAPKMIESPI